MLRNEGVNPAVFAASVRALIDEDPRRYRNFGVYWYFVKALLKRFYDRNEMPILGAYEDPAVVARMPPLAGAAEAMELALAEYQHNAAFNLGRNVVEDEDGATLMLIDPDVEG